MGAARTALVCLAGACALLSPSAGGAGVPPACTLAGGPAPCARERMGGMLRLRLRGGEQEWGSSSGDLDGILEGEGQSRRPQKKGRADRSDSDEDKVITFKPGQDMGKGSLRLVPRDKKTPRVNKMEPILADEAPAVSITFGEPDKPPNEPSRFKNDWWTGCSRDDIMDYIRIRDEERTPDACNNQELNEDLVWAAEQGDVNKIKRLVASGAEVNAGGACGSSQWVALHHAARHEQTAACIALLDLGTRVNVHTWGKWTALHFACATQNADLVKALVERGADVYAVNADGETPYDQAMWTSKDYLDKIGYDKDKAAELKKKSVDHIAPQLPRDSDGELHNMFQVRGEPDTYMQRLMAGIKPKVERIGDNIFTTYSNEEIDFGEPAWKEELYVGRDDNRGELADYMDGESSSSDLDSAEEALGLARKHARSETRAEDYESD